MIPTLAGGTGLLVALAILLLIRGDRLHVSNGVGWLLVAVVCALLGFAPSVVDAIALKLGVAYPPALAFTLALAVVVLKFLLEDIQNTKLRMRQQRVIQRLAMVETELKELKKSLLTQQSSKQSNPSQHQDE